MSAHTPASAADNLAISRMAFESMLSLGSTTRDEAPWVRPDGTVIRDATPAEIQVIRARAALFLEQHPARPTVATRDHAAPAPAVKPLFASPPPAPPPAAPCTVCDSAARKFKEVTEWIAKQWGPQQ